MGYKEVFEVFYNTCLCSNYKACKPKCTIKLTAQDKKEYEECQEIDYELVDGFLSSLIKSRCLTDNQKIPIYNLIFKRTVPIGYSTVANTCINNIVFDCLLKTAPPSVSNKLLIKMLPKIGQKPELVQFCLDRAQMDKDWLKVLISISFDEDDDCDPDEEIEGDDKEDGENEDDKEEKENNIIRTQNQLIVNKVTETILGNLNIVDDSLMNYICCRLNTYWNLFDVLVNKGISLINKHYSLIMVYNETETIEKVIQKTRPLLTNEYFREIIYPSKFDDVPKLCFNSHGKVKDRIRNKVKLLQKYGYVVTREDWILALQHKITFGSGVNFVGDEDVLKICIEKHFFPELQWKSEELRKKYELIALMNGYKVSKIRTWIKKNNYVPDEDVMVYACQIRSNGPVLDLLVKSGGKVTAKVLHQSVLGSGTRGFLTKVAKYYEEN